MLTVVKSAVFAVLNHARRRWPVCVEPDAKAPSPPPVGLCELPVELLAMILEQLDWRDVLRVRMVCKALQGVTKTRSVWLNLCRPHFSPTATAPQALHLERPIKLYTSRDLEFLFLRWKSADVGWGTCDKPARKREIETINTPQSMCLVEGGRWLLVASATGSITYFDLDASELIENILVPDQFDPLLSDDPDPDSEIKVVMSIDRDTDSTFLAFNLAVSFCLGDTPPPDPKAQGVQVWRVALALDDQQQGIGLTAEHLASFPLEPSVDVVFCQSLRGPHLSLTLLAMEHQDSQLTFIIDWKQADGDQTNYSRRLVHPPFGKIPKAIHLLPDNKLFTVAHQGLMIFDYLSIPETTSLPPVDFTDPTIIPLWRESCLGIDSGLKSSSSSKPFFCSHSIRFSIRGRDTVHGVIIDYPYNEGPSEPLGQFVTLMEKLNVKMKVHEYYGFNKAIIFSGPVGTYLFNYPWPDEPDNHLSSVSLHTEGAFRDLNFGPFLDEQSGRVVVPVDAMSRAKHRHDRTEIWDFALLLEGSPAPL